LDDLDDSGGFTPALVLPIGTLRTNIKDLITEAGIPENLLKVTPDSIYVVYEGSMSMELMSNIPGLSNGEVINNIPEGIRLGFANGEKSIDIDVFEALASRGNALYPADPQIRLQIKNYIGADLDINVNRIASYGSDNRQKTAMFGNSSSYTMHVGSAPRPREYTPYSEIFDTINGKLHHLFSIAPSRLSCDFSVDLTVPNDGQQHFIVGGQYVDLDYEIKIPMTFDERTQLVSADTLDFDLSGNSFVSDLDNLVLWIKYENGIPATVNLDILFLDENQQAISGIDRHFHLDASPVAATKDVLPYPSSSDLLTFKFGSSEIETAKKARYVVLKTMLKVASGSSNVTIRPTDFINLKLNAYSKVNI
jgi:hypothetical protein